MRKVITAAASVALFVGVLGVMAPSASANEPHDGCAPWEDGVTILGSPQRDRIVGTDCDDVLLGFGGNDRIRGKHGTDLIRGGRGNDRLSAAGETGRINGGGGFDTCVVDVDSEIVVVRCEVILEVDA